jgi:hypothetical protein
METRTVHPSTLLSHSERVSEGCFGLIASVRARCQRVRSMPMIRPSQSC